jgi:hypothetical protein
MTLRSVTTCSILCVMFHLCRCALCTVAMVTMAPGVTGPGAIEVTAGEGALSPPGPSAAGVGMTFRTQVLAKARPTRRATLGTTSLVATAIVFGG